MTLYQLEPGQIASCCEVDCPNREVRRRLLEMGFCNHSAVEVLQKQKHGLIRCKLRGYCIALRQSEAECIKCSERFP
jgi:Fe2+ transport system protein FeoA